MTPVTTLHFDADALESFVYIPLRSSHVLGGEYHHNRLRANTSVMFLVFILEHTAGLTHHQMPVDQQASHVPDIREYSHS